MNTTTRINCYDDIIDSRDVIARIDELQSERDEYCSDSDKYADDWATEYPEDAAELTSLESLAEEAEGYAGDWQYGEALIHNSYFTEYIIDMLKDCGTLPSDIPWYIEIDEEKTADNCKADYTSVDFDGETYWIR